MRACMLLLVLSALLMGPLSAPGKAGGFAEGARALQAKDFSTALRIFKELGGQGHARAQFNLGLMYENGDGVEQDYGNARSWYREAARNGDPRAQYNLGLMHMRGKGVVQDYERAGMLFLQAAVQDYARAQFNLGIMYDESLGVPLNYSKSVQWRNRAFRNGFVKGRHDLGPHGLVRTRASYYLSESTE